VGFEPTNGGFADLSLGPLGYRAGFFSIANLHSLKPHQVCEESLILLLAAVSLLTGLAEFPSPSPVHRYQLFCYDA
jgi:hypothetical protein